MAQALPVVSTPPQSAPKAEETRVIQLDVTRKGKAAATDEATLLTLFFM